MNSGEAFEEQVSADLTERYGHLGVSFKSHGSGDDAFSNDIAVSGHPVIRNIETKQDRAPTGQFTLAVEDGCFGWSDSSRFVGPSLDESATIIDWLNRLSPDPEKLLSAVMGGRTTVPVLCDRHVLGEWARKNLLAKGNDLLVTGTLGIHDRYGCLDLRVPGCLDGRITATVRKRTSGTRDVPPARLAAAAEAVSRHLVGMGVPAGSFSLETRPHKAHRRLHVAGTLPDWGRRDAARYVLQENGDRYYVSPNDQAVRVLSAGSGSPCVSFWGDFRGVRDELEVLDAHIGLPADTEGESA